MKRELILVAAVAAMFTGCERDEVTGDVTGCGGMSVDIVGGRVTPFAGDIGVRSGGGTALGDGCRAEVYASGGFTAEGVVFTLVGDVWTCEEELRWSGNQGAEVIAYCPPRGEIYDDGKLADLLVCNTCVDYGSTVTLSFEHAFAQMVFNVSDDLNGNLKEIGLTPSLTVAEIDAWTGEMVCTGDVTETARFECDESAEYSIMVPANVNIYISICITTADGTTLTAETEGYELEAGKRYGCVVEKGADAPGIYTAEDLVAFSYLINGTEYEGRSLAEFGVTEGEVTTYMLMEDIVLTEGQSAEVCGIGQSSATAFGDVFDGQGHYISGFVVDGLELSASSSYGLFCYIGDAGVVKNLTIREFSVSESSGSEINNIALLCGVNCGIIDGCRVEECSLMATQCEYLGCMVGLNQGTVVNSCCVGCSVVNSYSGSDTPVASGLIGTNQADVLNCYVANCSLSCGYSAGICCKTSTTNKVTNVYAYEITNEEAGSHSGLVYKTVGSTYTWCFSESSSSNQFGNSSSSKSGAYTFSQAEGELPKYDGEELYVYFNEWIDENPDYSSDYEVVRWEANDLTEPYVFLLE